MKFALTSSLIAQNNPLQRVDNLIIDSLNKRGIENILINPNTYETHFYKNEVQIYSQGNLVSDSDILLVKRTKGSEQQIYELAKSMETAGVLSVDNADSLVYLPAKLVPQLYRVGNVNFPVSAFLQNITNNTLQTIKDLGIRAPFIIKPQNGKREEGVELISNLDQLQDYKQKYPNTPIIIQEKLDIANEYRVMVLGNNSLGACRKKTNEIIKNAELGAEFEYLRDERIENFAIKAAQCQPGDIFGVDVAQTKSGELYIIEANRNPNFIAFRQASQISIEDKIINYCISKLKK